MYKKCNLILDLDNTLIHAVELEKIKGEIPKWYKSFDTFYIDKDFIVAERPHVQSFLTWAFKNFNVSVWSAGSESYVRAVIKKVITRPGRKLRRIFHYSTCEKSMETYGDDHIKNLKYLWDILKVPGFNSDNTVILDDLDDVVKNNKNNVIKIKKFFATKHTSVTGDDNLLKAKEKLEKFIQSRR